MSKSVGNVLDPLAVIEGRTLDQIREDIEADNKEEIEHLKAKSARRQLKNAERDVKSKLREATKAFPDGIREGGADQLRMALIDYTRQARQINMELRHVDKFRKLSIKIDNAFKFYKMAQNREVIDENCGGSLKTWINGLDKGKMRPHDWYILYQLRKLVVDCNMAFEERKLYKATEAIRAFTFDELCGVYLDFIKHDVAVDADPEV